MTGQIPEILILDGAERCMTFSQPLPWHQPRLKELSDAEIDARMEKADREHKAAGHEGCSRLDWFLNSTGRWRQYVGTWEIRDGLLYLISVEGRYELIGEGVFADCFTGTLRVPQGEVLMVGSSGAVTEEEIRIAVAQGQVTGRHIVDNRWMLSATDRPPIEDPY